VDVVKVYTRGGDQGETSLFGGERVPKDALRVEGYGAVDELNAVIGLARAAIEGDDLHAIFGELQNGLFDLGGELATPDALEREARGKGIPRVADADIERMERWIDRFDTELEPLRNFVLPGGHPGAAWLQLARTVARRAERRVVALARVEPLPETAVRYLNRLSDLLFVMARVVNARAGIAEPTWEGRKR
jgi:cob(I)alamin adenosyltransferase